MRASSSNSPREKRRRRHQTTSQGPFGEDRSEALGITGRFHRRGRSQQRRRHVPCGGVNDDASNDVAAILAPCLLAATTSSYALLW